MEEEIVWLRNQVHWPNFVLARFMPHELNPPFYLHSENLEDSNPSNGPFYPQPGTQNGRTPFDD